VGGVVYTSMFDPADGRKNWHDLLTGFCWAFREVEDATLILKMVKGRTSDYRRDLFLLLSRLAPFKCRVVTIDGYLEDAEYDALIAATTYYVNTSHCEGLCMPLMEFMSAGKPAIAPRHTAMADYVDEGAAFIVESSPEHNVWPGDPRFLFLTMRERIHWDSVVAAYERSYRVAKDDPRRYAEMGGNAVAIMSRYCPDNLVRERLRAAAQQAVEIAARRAEICAALDVVEATDDLPESETA